MDSILADCVVFLRSKVFDFSDIDGIFVELFKKANDFEICIEHLKRSRKFKYNFLRSMIWDFIEMK